MDKITIIFTKTNWSLISWLIRYTLPRSRFAFALSSHCYIVDNNSEDYYEADPFKGIRRIKKSEAITNNTVIVKECLFTVPDIEKGFDFLIRQLGKGYDFKAAFGIGLSPLRDWNEDDKWYCYELAAAALRAAGRGELNSVTYVNEYALMIIADKE